MAACTHKAYATRISARKAAEGMGLTGIAVTRAIQRCPACGKWRVVV